MPRLMEIRLEKRNVSCVARLLDDDAPLTAGLVWDALPLGGDAWHAKYAMNEVYCYVPPINGAGPGLENPTVAPVPGDVVYFYFPKGHLARRLREERGIDHLPGVVDLAVFYGRHNFLFNLATGFVPGNVYATVVENLPAFASGCHDVWRSGSVGEQLTYRRL
jgi:Protein of unknown function (DUF3830)